jgi:hypothetical protein
MKNILHDDGKIVVGDLWASKTQMLRSRSFVTILNLVEDKWQVRELLLNHGRFVLLQFAIILCDKTVKSFSPKYFTHFYELIWRDDKKDVVCGEKISLDLADGV